ncbi:fibronectin type III domain-containing protein [Tenacibaculum finnmarkense genomovar ulcerans]|uniref:fibronectin type III domain-containing protein n=1 Tax=Tenacibaculum finnmarkense TaxID=2781243 RepID=UPI001E31C580|nr:fibronectin type III domain-containing protein [Tenacibaculum finnmarkense]MCD8454881.1 fibronectin type III domain-containing protein [Tenacibaculum finnmarkense genomovar ulcerans]
MKKNLTFTPSLSIQSFIFLFFIALSSLTSCSEEEQEDRSISINSIDAENIQFNSTTLKWYSSISGEKTTAVFDIYLNDKLIKKGYEKNSFELSNLTPNTQYSGKIIGRTNFDTNVEKTFSFTTADYPDPLSFNVLATKITSESAVITWKTPKTLDQATLTYSIYVNGEVKKENIAENTAGNFYKITDLVPYKEYIIRVIATTDKNKQTFKEISFNAFATSFQELTLTSKNITQTAANIDWNVSTVDYLDANIITYDIYLNGTLLIENTTETTHLLQNLTPNKYYTAKVIAKLKNGDSIPKKIEFKTLGTPPSDFTVSLKGEAQPNWTEIQWTLPTVADDVSFKYNLYLNDEIIDHDILSFVDNLTLTDLKEASQYTLKLVAIANNGTETFSNTITFKTITYPKINGDLILNFSNNLGTSVIAYWTPVSYTHNNENKRVYYNISIKELNNYDDSTTKLSRYLNNLKPNTSYTVRIKATVTDSGFNNYIPSKTIEKTITTAQDYPLHPTIKITEAILYAKNSRYFPGQIRVKFSEKISDIDVETFFASTMFMNNFQTYSSSILSNKLSNSKYDYIINNFGGNLIVNQGYVVFNDAGKTYRIPYSFHIDSN